MTTKPSRSRKFDDDAIATPPIDGFDITCTIGRVEFSSTGDVSPHIAAFKLIGEHGAEGHFQFPSEDGGTCHVTVEHQSPVYGIDQPYEV